MNLSKTKLKTEPCNSWKLINPLLNWGTYFAIIYLLMNMCNDKITTALHAHNILKACMVLRYIFQSIHTREWIRKWNYVSAWRGDDHHEENIKGIRKYFKTGSGKVIVLGDCPLSLWQYSFPFLCEAMFYGIK